MAEINVEMSPWLAMTYPREAATASLEQARTGETLFTSWVLFLRFLPIERWRLRLAEIGPGRRFVEESGTLGLRTWRHERRVEEAPRGCVLTDRVTLEARLPFVTPLVALFVGWFFGRRHATLRKLFGGVPGKLT
jgi:hypothetical protein